MRVNAHGRVQACVFLRELDGRPTLTINRLPAFIRQVVNDARQNKPGMLVHPVGDGADPATAEVLNGLIRHIEQSSDAEVACSSSASTAGTRWWGDGCASFRRSRFC